MTSRTNYYRTVSQVFKFDEEQHNNQLQAPLVTEQEGKKNETFYVDVEEEYLRGDLPEVFGPHLWFCLHNAAVYYPLNASPAHAERMRNVIVGLPVLIPCETCKEHATKYIEEKKHMLMEICKTRETLFNFFVDFHNYVNIRLEKKVWTYDEAKAMYQ